MYDAQVSATAESALGARTSTSAMCESPSGGARIVAGPRTDQVHSAGAMKVAPSTVCFGVSATRRSEAGLVAPVLGLTVWLQEIRVSSQAAASTGPPRRERSDMGVSEASRYAVVMERDTTVPSPAHDCQQRYGWMLSRRG